MHIFTYHLIASIIACKLYGDSRKYFHFANLSPIMIHFICDFIISRKIMLNYGIGEES